MWNDAGQNAIQAFSTFHLHILSPDLTKGSIWTNASNRGLEAILLQKHGGMLHPLQFYNATIANQKLLDHETGYSTTESKYLAGLFIHFLGIYLDKNLL